MYELCLFVVWRLKVHCSKRKPVSLWENSTEHTARQAYESQSTARLCVLAFEQFQYACFAGCLALFPSLPLCCMQWRAEQLHELSSIVCRPLMAILSICFVKCMVMGPAETQLAYHTSISALCMADDAQPVP